MKLFFVLVSSFLSLSVLAQQEAKKLYDPQANAAVDIAAAVKKAAAENKYVLLQAGGNWCSWCIEFNRFVKSNAQLDSIVKANYLVYHLNYSKENKNIKLLTSKSAWLRNLGFYEFCAGGCGKQYDENNTIRYSRKSINLCFDCFIDKNEELSKKYNSRE